MNNKGMETVELLRELRKLYEFREQSITQRSFVERQIGQDEIADMKKGKAEAHVNIMLDLKRIIEHIENKEDKEKSELERRRERIKERLRYLHRKELYEDSRSTEIVHKAEALLWTLGYIEADVIDDGGPHITPQRPKIDVSDYISVEEEE